MTKDEFIDYCSKLNINIDNDKLSKFELYKDLLIEWNNKFNLTSIINEKDIYLKHFYDCLCLLKSTDLNNKEILDFGTGAGFPGMVLAIVLNNSNITLVESNNKKVLFLQKLKEELNLNNVNIICDRIETYGKKVREKYDIVTCRAVSHLNIILELSISLLKVNGLFIPMKSNVDEELKESNNKSKLLGYELEKTINYTLPIEGSNRSLLIYRKTKVTDLKYPRNYNIIKKSN